MCTSHNTRMWEVCQGPDCRGAGGGAVALELEELLQEEKEEHGAIVSHGACRDCCAVGPNVYYFACRQQQQHYTAVKSIEECHRIFYVETGKNDEEDTTISTSTIVESFRLRQSRAARWKLLRRMARFQRQLQSQQQTQANNNEIASLRADLQQYCCSAGNNHEREQRRQERLREMLERIVTQKSAAAVVTTTTTPPDTG